MTTAWFTLGGYPGVPAPPPSSFVQPMIDAINTNPAIVKRDLITQVLMVKEKNQVTY
jgi:hypothetical protein